MRSQYMVSNINVLKAFLRQQVAECDRIEEAKSYLDDGRYKEDLLDFLRNAGMDIEETISELIVDRFKLRTYFVIATPDLLEWTNEDAEYWRDQLVRCEDMTYCFKCDIEATSEEEALDKFHETYPIDCLDDWHIEAIPEGE